LNLTFYSTNNYDNKSGLLTMEKQTQSNPILSASGGFVFFGIFYLATAVFYLKFLMKANVRVWQGKRPIKKPF